MAAAFASAARANKQAARRATFSSSPAWPITPTSAVTVPTLDGPVTLTVPPRTSSGSKLRIKGRGIFRGEEKGDELVAIKIIVPRELDEEDRKTIEKLAQKHPINAREDVKWQ